MVSLSQINESEYLLIISSNSFVSLPLAILDDTVLNNTDRVTISPAGEISIPKLDEISKVEFVDSTPNESSMPVAINEDKSSLEDIISSKKSTIDKNRLIKETEEFQEAKSYPKVIFYRKNNSSPRGTMAAVLKSTLNIQKVIIDIFLRYLAYRDMNEKTFEDIQHFIEDYFVGKVYVTKDVDWIHFEELYEKMETSLTLDSVDIDIKTKNTPTGVIKMIPSEAIEYFIK